MKKIIISIILLVFSAVSVCTGKSGNENPVLKQGWNTISRETDDLREIPADTQSIFIDADSGAIFMYSELTGLSSIGLIDPLTYVKFSLSDPSWRYHEKFPTVCNMIYGLYGPTSTDITSEDEEKIMQENDGKILVFRKSIIGPVGDSVKTIVLLEDTNRIWNWLCKGQEYSVRFIIPVYDMNFNIAETEIDFTVPGFEHKDLMKTSTKKKHI